MEEIVLTIYLMISLGILIILTVNMIRKWDDFKGEFAWYEIIYLPIWVSLFWLPIVVYLIVKHKKLRY